MRALRESRHWPGFAVLTVLVLSLLLFVGTHLLGRNRESLAVWVLGSWPTLIALAAGLFLLEAGPLRSWPALGSGQGESVKRLSGLFARAKEQSPSIIFFDELDGLFGTSHGFASAHDTQFTEQALIEISRIEASHNVLLVGATNHPDRLDPRVLRGGRFSEKIAIRVPGPDNRARLLRKLLGESAVSVSLERLVEDTDGLAPADIEAVVQAARRFAFGRSENDDRLPPLTAQDFARALERVDPVRYEKPARAAAFPRH